MAQRFAQGIIFGLVPSSATTLCDSFGVTEFPTLLLVTPTEQNTLPFSADAVSLKALFEEIAQSPNSPPPTTSQRQAAQVEFKWSAIDTKEKLDEKCSKMRCVVLFGGDEQLKDSVLQSFAPDGKLAFVAPSAGSDLRKLFGDGEESMLVVYDAKRERYIKAGDLHNHAVHALLERVLSGDATYTPL